MTTAFVRGIAVASLAVLGAACSSSSTGPATTGPTSNCDISVKRFNELAIVDDAVVGDHRSRNGENGVWSFRHQIESMTPTNVDASTFVTTWLLDWATRKELNNVPLDREPRDAQMNAVVICPWLLRTPANACDTTCSSCAGRKLDMAVAPFRLIAVMNRMDLHERPDATGPSGEARLAFALTAGPGDDPASPTKPMSVIFEYALPDSLNTKQWAEAWHTLAAFDSYDEPYRVALEAVTTRFASRGSAPSRTNGSALTQVRTNESGLNWIWQLREFGLDPSGNLLLSTVKNTPAESFNGTAELATLIRANADKVKADQFVIPAYMLSGSIDQFLFRWQLPGTDEATRLAFSRTTCNGCHAADNPTVDTAFHLSPFRSGQAKLSPFLNDPSNRSTDELTRRELSIKTILCQK